MRPHAGVKLLDEFLFSLRRAGLTISTAQSLDCARALSLVGFEEKRDVKNALFALLVTKSEDVTLFERAFELHFSGDLKPRDLFERLRARGFSDADIGELRAILFEMANASADVATFFALAERGADLDHALQSASVLRALEAAHGPLQSGFVTHKVLAQIGTSRASNGLFALASRLTDALGKERADALTAALRDELSRAEDDVRAHVKDKIAPRETPSQDAMHRTFASLSPEEILDVRRAVKKFVERLAGRERVRRRLRKRGRIDPHATLRRAMRTHGVPIFPVYRAKRQDRAKLFVFSDVSDSVRASARFLLEFAYLARELFDRTRTFAFVSDLIETTALFEAEPIDRALARVYGGSLLSVRDNSNYGRVLAAIEERYAHEFDRKTTVVILGDGRANYMESGVDAVARIRARARAVIWLCPEPKSAWSVGDSRMRDYARVSSQVFEMTNARELERAARAIAG